MKEILYLDKHSFLDLYFLIDSAGNILGRYEYANLNLAYEFCQQNNYELREA